MIFLEMMLLFWGGFFLGGGLTIKFLEWKGYLTKRRPQKKRGLFKDLFG